MYKFSLQILLDYRKRLEDGLQIELSQIQRLFDAEKQQLLSYRKEKLYYEEELLKKEERGIEIKEALLYQDYLRGMRKKIDEQRTRVANLAKDLSRKREELLEATKKRKVLEKIRDRDWKRFREILWKKERSLIEELGLRNYQRKVNGIIKGETL